MWDFLDIRNENWIYLDIAFISIILFITFSYLRSIRKKRLNDQVVPLADEFLDQLFEALGRGKNITKVSSEHQRLKVVLNDVKQVDTIRLKQLNIPAFLKGKEVTLLIKNHTKEVLSFFNDKIREEN